MVILYPRVEGCSRTEDQHQEQQDDVHADRVSGRQYMAHGIPCQEKIRFSCEVRKRVSLRSYVRLRVRRWQRTRSEQLKEVRRRENPTWRVGFHRGRFEECFSAKHLACGVLCSPTCRVMEEWVGSSSALRVFQAPWAESTGHSSALQCRRCDPVVQQG